MDEQGQGTQADEKLVMVASFRDLSEALLAKGRLDAAEIPCVLADDNIARMDWFLSNLLGGVKLNVPESQFETAHELLFGTQEVAPGEQPVVQCPKCGSNDVGAIDPDRGVRLAALAMVSLPLPRLSEVRWQCASCGAKWVEEEEQ